MKKSDWALVLSLVLITWLIDYVTKQWAATNVVGMNFWGPFGLVLHFNPGAMLGTFSNLPPLLRVVTLSTGGAFLVFIYACLQYLIPQRSMIVRCGMSFLLGGILGNVTDRIILGKVIDFLLIKTPWFVSPAFNFADAIQWVGYAMVVYVLITQGETFWPSNNVRKKVWVLPKFQIKYISVLLTIGIGFTAIAGVFSYTFLKITIDDLAPYQALAMEQKFLGPFLITFSIISFGFMLILFIVGRILSHRTAGPIYAFEKYVNELMSGGNRNFKLRKSDEFGHLEQLASQLKEQLTHLKQQVSFEEPLPEEEFDDDKTEEISEIKATKM